MKAWVSGIMIGSALLYARGSYDSFSFLDIALAYAGAFAYFGAIHLLLMQWDRWRGRRTN